MRVTFVLLRLSNGARQYSIFPGIASSWLNVSSYCWFVTQYSKVFLVRDSVFPGIAGSWLNIPRYCCSWLDIPRYCGFMSHYSKVLLVRDSYPQVLLVSDSVFPGIAGLWLSILRYCWFVIQVSFGPPVKQLLFNQCVPTPRKKKKKKLAAKVRKLNVDILSL